MKARNGWARPGTKIAEMDTPAPLRRRKERESGRRGDLDDLGTGWSLFTRCDTWRWMFLPMTIRESWGGGGGSDSLAASFLFGKVPEPVTDSRRWTWSVDTVWRTESVTLIWQSYLAVGLGQSPRQEEAVPVAGVDTVGSSMSTARVT